jgi:hypothetical protein
MRYFAILTSLIAVFAAQAASAECCRLLKVDAETPPSQLRACEPDLAGECGALLFVGTLALGEEQAICASSDEIVYQEFDEALAAFQPPVRAICDDNDVEL